MPTSTQLYERGHKALTERTDWERKLARQQLQRFQQDRSRQNNIPWPKASNLRYPLSDTMIQQKKPFLFKLLYASEQVAHFKGMTPQTIPLAANVGAYFDFIIKEKTDLETQIQYCIDSSLQDGETVMKIYWDTDKETPCFEYVDNLFLIQPSSATDLQTCEWVYQVLQFTKRSFREHYKKFLNEEELTKIIGISETVDHAENDQSQREDSEYQREGINKSGKLGRIVVWECHYLMDDGTRRIRTVSPDNSEFDFKDDREYPYDYKKDWRWMFCHHKNEIVKPQLHSSRGIPEIVADGEHSLTNMWRSLHNSMALYNQPVYVAPNGMPGNTQNYNIVPGQILPFALEQMPQGAPPMSWYEEMNNTRSVWERRVSSPDFGIGRGNSQNDARTAREVSAISNLQALAVDLDAGNWKRFLRSMLGQAWKLIVQHKPKSLSFYMKQDFVQLDPAALNNDYMITLSGSAENANKEWMVQKAIALFQMTQGNPFANTAEAWKNVLERLEPQQVQRFFQDPGQKQQQAFEKTAEDIGKMLNGFPVAVEQQDNFLVQASTTVQFMMRRAATGLALDHQQAGLLSKYIADNREQLKKTNPAGYKALTDDLNQIDLQQKQNAARQHIASQLPPNMPQNGRAMQPAGLPPPPPPANGQPMQGAPVA